MKRSVFEAELNRAASMARLENTDYWNAFQRGLRRRFHGDKFGEESDHIKWIGYDDDRGAAYRDGYFGPCNWSKTQTAVKTLRRWRGWNTATLGEKLGKSPRTIEEWEQGRRSPDKSAIILLKMLHAYD